MTIYSFIEINKPKINIHCFHKLELEPGGMHLDCFKHYLNVKNGVELQVDEISIRKFFF